MPQRIWLITGVSGGFGRQATRVYAEGIVRTVMPMASPATPPISATATPSVLS
jgi:hypothetical protein